MRALVTAAIVAALAVSTTASVPAGEPSATVVVTAKSVPLDRDRPNVRRAGKLIYRGGLELSSKDGRFGGLSDIEISSDGMRVLMVSDASHWVRARLTYDKQGNLSGFSDVEIAPMLDLAGSAMEGKEGDAEGLAAEVAGEPWGTVLVSFERDHRVWRYDLSGGLNAKPTPVPIGSWIDSLPSNQGLEAIALLPHETLLAISETTRDPQDDIVGALEAYPMQTGHGGYGAISIRAREPFAVTSAKPDAEGGVFILERRFSFLGGFGAELRHVPAADIRPGAHLEGTVLAELAGEVDNMEGLAMRRGADGKAYLYILSDDNFSGLQRTLLLMFELAQ